MKKYLLLLILLVVTSVRAEKIERYTSQWLEIGLNYSLQIHAGKDLSEEEGSMAVGAQDWFFGFLQGMGKSGNEAWKKLVNDKGPEAAMASVVEYIKANDIAPSEDAQNVVAGWYFSKYSKK